MSNKFKLSSKNLNRFAIIGLNIAYYRKKNKLTQEELADIVGISRVHLSKIEAPNIDSSISLVTLFDIADALEIPPAKLLEER